MIRVSARKMRDVVFCRRLFLHFERFCKIVFLRNRFRMKWNLRELDKFMIMWYNIRTNDEKRK